MLFSTPLFLFLYLPIVLGIYFLIRSQARNLFLVIASLFFYAWGEGFYILLLFFSMSINYFFGILIVSFKDKSKIILTAAVAINLMVLAYYKYAAFFLFNLNEMLIMFGDYLLSIGQIHLPGLQSIFTLVTQSIYDQNVALSSLYLPLGISFYTFHAISYLIDIYRKDAPPQKNPINLALYFSIFPQLIAGPIIRYHDISDQLIKRMIIRSDLVFGIQRFIIGLGKKVIIANPLAYQVDQIFSLPPDQLTTSLSWLGIICYTMQIYFDFSGYSDMAIGLARMFGFRFPENFNYPYTSQSIQEFWRRWHISLSTWFRDYLYVPLGGNRVKPLRVYFNLLVVFFLCGLWHGASWNFIVWGLIHGIFLALERMGLGKWLAKQYFVIRHIYTMLVVILAWVFFRSDNITNAFSYLIAMTGFGKGNDIQFNVGMYSGQEVWFVLLAAILGSVPLKILLEKTILNIPTEFVMLSRFLYLGGVFWVSASYLAAGTYNPFIYFRF